MCTCASRTSGVCLCVFCPNIDSGGNWCRSRVCLILFYFFLIVALLTGVLEMCSEFECLATWVFSCTFPLSESQPLQHPPAYQIRCMLACQSALGLRDKTTHTCTRARAHGQIQRRCRGVLRAFTHVWFYSTHTLWDLWSGYTEGLVALVSNRKRRRAHTRARLTITHRKTYIQLKEAAM